MTAPRTKTIDDIASMAGVSAATVSKVINNRPYVSAEKRATIERVIAETGFVPSQRARGLSKRRSFILGLLIPYTSDQLFSDPHLLECVRGIESEVNAREYNLLLSTARAPSEAASACVRLLRTDVIDGAIVLETHDLHQFSAMLGQRTGPLVFIGYPQAAAIPAVHADDYGGALAAMRHLLGAGHRRIGIISSHLRPFAIEERMRGVADALAEAGLMNDPALVALGDFSPESGEAAARALLGLADQPTAIFSLNDRMALGAMRAAAALGLHIPADLSLVGFDDVALAALATPQLTTVRQPGFALGAAAARLVFGLLDGVPLSASPVIPTELIVRGSTAARRAERA
ncbi:MAG: LacI family DNA-binding transcriptional regulator [Roseiflexaceae bacterium]|nr:LacI family DNA-binding transcriptional regulator [Roseiflexaceae bacterium]